MTDQNNELAALKLAVAMLAPLEPGDSRMVSDEFVALAAVSVGDTSPEVMDVIHDALRRTESAPKAEKDPRCMTENEQRATGATVIYGRGDSWP